MTDYIIRTAAIAASQQATTEHNTAPARRSHSDKQPGQTLGTEAQSKEGAK